MTTIKQVSKHANVSTATVSRVINNPESVKPTTRDRVQAAMKELGYQYNVVAAALVSNKTNTVGYVVPELHGYFFGSLMSGSEAVLRQANKHLFVTAGHSDEALEQQAISDLQSRRCDALILHVEAVSDAFLIELAAAGGPPFVVVNRHIPEIADRCISLDNVLGGFLATEALVKAGHQDIAYISGALWKADGRDRLNGHIEALQSANLPYNPILTVEGDFRSQSGYHAIMELSKRGQSFSAVACANDEMAAGAMDAIRELGLRIPEDVSIVGFDDVEFSRYTYPKLTTVNYPSQAIGELAAKWTLEKVYKQQKLDLINKIEPVLVTRDSIASHTKGPN